MSLLNLEGCKSYDYTVRLLSSPWVLRQSTTTIQNGTKTTCRVCETLGYFGYKSAVYKPLSLKD